MLLQPRFFTIPTASIFHLTGKDCTRYLNARLSNNIRDLPAQRGCAAAALSPQGRTEIFATILKITPEEYYVICDGGDVEENKKLLLRYKVADRVDCMHRDDLGLIHLIQCDSSLIGGLLPEALETSVEWQPLPTTGGFVFRHQRSFTVGFDLLAERASIGELAEKLRVANTTEIDETERLLLRIKGHRPSFPGELNSNSIFLEAGLSYAISFTKGCYVGQEVMEKVDSHGRLPFELVSLVSVEPAPVPPPEATVSSLSGEGGNWGEVLCAAQESSTGLSYCFARLKASARESGVQLKIGDKEYQIL